MASDDSTRRPSSGRWTSSPEGPWTPALNAITSNNTTHRLGVTTINAGPSSSTTPANSGQLTHDSHYEKQALRQARQQRPKKHGRDPNPDIGVLQPIPSTECKGLPPATGVTFTSGNTIRRGHGEQLDPAELSPSPFAVPNWDDFGSVVEMQKHGWEGFQEWLQHAVLPGRAHRWKKYTNVAIPAMVYYDGSTPLGAVFFAQDHGTGYPGTAFTSWYVQIVISFVQLRLD